MMSTRPSPSRRYFLDSVAITMEASPSPTSNLGQRRGDSQAEAERRYRSRCLACLESRTRFASPTPASPPHRRLDRHRTLRRPQSGAPFTLYSPGTAPGGHRRHNCFNRGTPRPPRGTGTPGKPARLASQWPPHRLLWCRKPSRPIITRASRTFSRATSDLCGGDSEILTSSGSSRIIKRRCTVSSSKTRSCARCLAVPHS